MCSGPALCTNNFLKMLYYDKLNGRRPMIEESMDEMGTSLNACGKYGCSLISIDPCMSV